MSALLDGLGAAAIAAGALFFLAGTVGLLRFPDPLSRVHALAKADAVGLGLIVLGLLPHAADVATGAKLVAVWALVQLAGTAASQLLASAARRGAASG